MLIFPVIFVVLIVLLYLVFIGPYKEIDKLPGPSSFEIIKNFYHYSYRDGIVAYFQTLNRKYGPIVKVWLKPLKPIIITSDMEYVEKILKSNELHITPTFLEMTFMGNGIASIPDFDLWKKDKQLIVKAITREYVAGKLCVYDDKFNEFLDIIRNNLEKPIDVEAPLHQIFLDIMMHTMKDSNVELTEQEVQNYTKYRKAFFNLLMERMNSFRMMGTLHKLTKNYKLMNECRDNIINFSKTWLEQFKKVNIELRDKHSLVYAMMNGGMPEERIVDNINTMISGGQETSIIPLALGFHEMTRQPEIQQRLVDEIYSVLGDDKTTPITLQDLDKMEYLHAFVKETLRYNQTAPYLDRRTIHDTKIKGVNIPKGVLIMFDLCGISRSEENFDDALVFNPDRFLKENLTIKTQKGSITFGHGLKTCPGKNIAYATMKLFIVKVLREFEICLPPPDHKLELVAEIFFRSTHGIPVIFKQRIY